MVSILVMSSDGYEDCWNSFFKLKEKYWKCDYNTYLCTETKQTKFATVLNTNGSWTSRLRQALEQIKSEHVILMLEDFFIRKEVDKKRIEYCIDNFTDNTAVFNFEQSWDSRDMETNLKGFKLRSGGSEYRCSCQPSIWNREKLISLLQKDQTAWEWETTISDSNYDFYINCDDYIIDIGYRHAPFAVTQGKYIEEDMIPLIKKEKLDIDISKRNGKLLSIIIPYYKTFELTEKLLNILIPQINEQVEVILVDDGCFETRLDKFPIKIIHNEHSGVSKTRNIGLNECKGQYIAFIDSDDEITQDYVEKCIKMANKGLDFFYLSWKTKDNEFIIKNEPEEWNTCIWNTVYSKKIIGHKRFNENMTIHEDTDFNERVRKGTYESILEPIYIYNNGRDGSLTDLYSKGVISMAQNKIIKTQLLIYRSFLSKLGGVETAIYNACKSLKDIYDIVFVYDNADPIQINRIRKHVQCVRFTGQAFECDVFLKYSFNPEEIDGLVKYKRKIQQICSNIEELNYIFSQKDKDEEYTADSKATAESFTKKTGLKCGVLHNLFDTKSKRCLNLMSATRLSSEKGYERMKSMAKRMIELDIPFEWTIFTNDLPNEEIDGFIFRKPKLNVVDYMSNKDYIIQLSDTESWGCTITESLECGTPVVCTNYASATEQVIENENGYILNKDLSNLDEIIDKMYKNNLKNFCYKKVYDIIEWKEQIGKLGKKTTKYIYDENEQEEDTGNVYITLDRVKNENDEWIEANQEITIFSIERARILFQYGLIKRKED